MRLSEAEKQIETLQSAWSKDNEQSPHGLEIGLDQKWTLPKFSRLVVKQADKRTIYVNYAEQEDAAQIYTPGGKMAFYPGAANSGYIRSEKW